MKFKSSILASASGSLGGSVFSRNRYGPYIRTRAVPVNPNTPLQQAVRIIFANLAAAWSGLTDLQRTSWDDYAANVTLIDKFGDPVNVTGFNMYIRSNVPRQQVGLDRVDDGPTDFTLPAVGIVVANATAAAGLLSLLITFDPAEPWVGEDGAQLLINVSRQMAPTINFFKGPFNSTEGVPGDMTMPPAPPVVILPGSPATVGNIVFLGVSVTRADGRLSTKSILVADIA